MKGSRYLGVDVGRQFLGIVVVESDHPLDGHVGVDVAPAVPALTLSLRPQVSARARVTRSVHAGIFQQFLRHPFVVDLHFRHHVARNETTASAHLSPIESISVLVTTHLMTGKDR